MINQARILDVFRRCGEAIQDASPEERPRILAALDALYNAPEDPCALGPPSEPESEEP